MRIISGKAKGTKLYTLEGINTRPTLDRVKESIFNIIQNQIENSVVLDLFSGSGAIGLEMISRGAKRAILCDNSKDAIKIIKKNIEKTHFEENVILFNLEYRDCINELKNTQFDIIYLDPPYNTNYIVESLKLIYNKNILKEEGLIILETDDKERIINEIKDLQFIIKDTRKYGRANIIFLNKKG